MSSFRLEVDVPNNIVLVLVTERGGGEHDFQLDYDPLSGLYEFAEKDQLEREYGEDFMEEMEEAVERAITEAIESSDLTDADIEGFDDEDL